MIAVAGSGPTGRVLAPDLTGSGEPVTRARAILARRAA